MKKFLAVIMAAVLLLSVSLPVFAISGEDLLKGALITVINEAVKQDQNKNKNSKSETQPKTQNETPQPSVTKSESEPDFSNMTEEEYYRSKEYDRLLFLSGRIENDLCELGNNILAYNKPALDIKLTKKERSVPEDEYDDSPNAKMILSNVMYNRVCVKGKTIVIGSAEKNKKFKTDLIITAEPDFPPAAKGSNQNVPRIYVGQDVNVLENFVGMSARNISNMQQRNRQKGTPITETINLDPTSFVFTNLAYKDNKIAELHHHNGYALTSDRAWNFAKKKAQELGLTFASTFNY